MVTTSAAGAVAYYVQAPHGNENKWIGLRAATFIGGPRNGRRYDFGEPYPEVLVCGTAPSHDGIPVAFYYLAPKSVGVARAIVREIERT